MALAGAPETDDRKQDGSQLDVDALLRQAMGGGAGDGRFGIKTGSAAPNALATGSPRTDSSFSVPSAGTTPPPRPTLGQRIAGDVPKPQPASTPAANAAPPQPAFNFDPSKLPDALRPAAITPSQVPQPPTGSQNPNRVSWMQKQAEDMKPLDRSDPKYKMGWGQRILGTVANFANGFARNGAAPIYVGPGATNWRFGRDEATRQENVARDTTALGEEEKLDASNEKKYQDAIQQAFKGQLGEKDVALGKAAEENAATKRMLEASQQSKNEADAELKRTKAGREPEPKTEAEIALAKQTAILRGDKAKAAVYDGALRELAKQKAAGKDTSAADVQKAILAAEFRSKEHDKVNADYEKERRDRTEEFIKAPAGRTDFNGTKLAQFSATLKQELDAKYAAQHQSIDSEADKRLSLTKSGASLKTGTAPASGAAKTPPKAGDTILVAGKPRKVVGWNPTTKKPIVAPEGQ